MTWKFVCTTAYSISSMCIHVNAGSFGKWRGPRVPFGRFVRVSRGFHAVAEENLEALQKDNHCGAQAFTYEYSTYRCTCTPSNNMYVIYFSFACITLSAYFWMLTIDLWIWSNFPSSKQWMWTLGNSATAPCTVHTMYSGVLNVLVLYNCMHWKVLWST